MSDLVEVTTTVVSALTGEVRTITTLEPAPEPQPPRLLREKSVG